MRFYYDNEYTSDKERVTLEELEEFIIHENGIPKLILYKCMNLKLLPTYIGKICNILVINNCPSLKFIYTSSVSYLFIRDCINLEVISLGKTLRDFTINDCPKFTTIKNIQDYNINNYEIFNCRMFINDKYRSGFCPFNKNDSQNGKSRWNKTKKKINILQKWIKKNFKYFVFKRWIKSKEFIEWFYSPENFGGYKHKQRMLKSI
jgi:hypothetical protein